jgi:hypothetical protein
MATTMAMAASKLALLAALKHSLGIDGRAQAQLEN